MVKPKIELLKWGIKNTKMRIKYYEKHGNGGNTMEEKRILVKQERIFDLLKQEGKI